MAPKKRPFESSQPSSSSQASPPLKKAKVTSSTTPSDAAAAPRRSRKDWKGSRGKAPVVKAFSRSERALLRKERRATKPHHLLIEQANSLYRFDFKRMDGTERKAKVESILQQSGGAMVGLLAKHDSSRVFQLMAKYGSPAQREAMLEGCRGHLLSLSLNHYAHHFVLKLAQYSTPPLRQAIWRELRGHVSELAFHVDGSVVLDYLWAAEKSGRQQRAMLRELYHPTFQLEAQTGALGSREVEKGLGKDRQAMKGGGEDELASLCAAHPSLSSSIIAHVSSLMERWLQKGLLTLRFVHAVLRQYLSIPSLAPASRAEALSSLCASPALSSLTGSADGVLVLCGAVVLGGAKERKAVLRCVKAAPLAVCTSPHGPLLLSSLISLVDDTVAVSKSLWSPALTDPLTAAQWLQDRSGAKVLLRALTDEATTGTGGGAADAALLAPFHTSEAVQVQLPHTPPPNPSQPSLASDHPLTISEVTPCPLSTAL